MSDTFYNLHLAAVPNIYFWFYIFNFTVNKEICL